MEAATLDAAVLDAHGRRFPREQERRQQTAEPNLDLDAADGTWRTATSRWTQPPMTPVSLWTPPTPRSMPVRLPAGVRGPRAPPTARRPAGRPSARFGMGVRPAVRVLPNLPDLDDAADDPDHSHPKANPAATAPSHSLPGWVIGGTCHHLLALKSGTMRARRGTGPLEGLHRLPQNCYRRIQAGPLPPPWRQSGLRSTW